MQNIVIIVLLSSIACTFTQNLQCVSNTRYVVPDLIANWYKATEHCNSFGMRLAVITSPEEGALVLEAIKSWPQYDSTTKNFWIGGSDLAEHGVFYWQPTGNRFGYTNWKYGQPDNTNGTEHCVEIRYLPIENELDWYWNDRQCDVKNPFVCENLEPRRVVVMF
ncbi:perlucin-like [Wyeomyia smithii]|uniref:perlucin-like n=1 Tax=Wyeomyia smithii TaxID=174621 RepID=UPI002467D168|nr:perlucin-like [Wyeomyia smithii]